MNLVLSFLMMTLSFQPLSVDIPEDPGTYPVTLYVEEEGQRVEKTIMVTVTRPTTSIDESKQQGIDASDVRVDRDTFNSLKLEDYIQLSNAYAWSMNDGHQLDLYVKSSHYVNDSHLRIELSTNLAYSKWINIYIRDEAYVTLNYQNIITQTKEVDALGGKIATITITMLVLPLLIISVVVFVIKRKSKAVEELLYKE